MRFNKNILLLANLLAVSAAHFVKRDFTRKKYEVYKNVMPTNNEQIAKDARNNNRIYKLERIEKEIDESFVKLDEGKYMKSLIDDPFILNVNCFSVQDCADYPEKVQEGAYYVAETFEFYQQVNVNVTIFPFCEYISDGCESIMGITYPPTFLSLSETENGESFLYPQALVKQLDVDSNVQYEDIDFIIYLNSNYHPQPAQDNRALIAAHEILHGLGFFHQINPISVYINNFQNYFQEDFALPPINYVETDTTIKYQGWTPFSIFDKFIVSTSNPNEYSYKKLEKFKNHDVNFEISIKKPTTKQYNDFMNTFRALENDQEAHIGGVQVARDFTTLNAVGFRTTDGSIVQLQTFDGTYESASSISHINVPFACKNSSTCNAKSAKINENYLMYFTVISRASTDKLISTFKTKSKHDLIGQDIVKVMCTLGWNERNGDSTTNNNNNDNKYTLSQGNYGSSDSSHLSSPSCVMILLSLLFLCFTHLI